MRNRNARVAGLLYVFAVIIGVFDLMYIPEKFNVYGDAAATAHNIAANEFLFRLGAVGDVIAGIVWLGVVLALYRLLEDVDRIQAWLMLILGAFMQVPIGFVNVLNRVAALLLVTDPNIASALPAAQRDVFVVLFLKLHYYDLLASYIFAGAWLIPFGILVYKSQFLPRTLGVLLIASGIANMMWCVTGFLWPRFQDAVYAISGPLGLAEVAIALWLLVFGARTLGFGRGPRQARDGPSTRAFGAAQDDKTTSSG